MPHETIAARARHCQAFAQGRMSRPAHSVTIRSAVSIYNWLVERTDPELPRFSDIGRLVLDAGDAYRVELAVAWLERQRMLTRHYSRGDGRYRHHAIRIAATGQVFKTAGCPFDPPLRARP